MQWLLARFFITRSGNLRLNFIRNHIEQFLFFDLAHPDLLKRLIGKGGLRLILILPSKFRTIA
jgi:hypothetical protein